MSAGPPFERYPVSAGAILASSQATASKANALVAVGINVQSAAQPAINGVSGLLAPPLISAPQPVLAQNQQLIQTTTLAAGAVRVFGLAIERYDAAIDRLNERWEAAVAADFGVGAAVIPAGADGQERQDLESARTSAVAAAREELRRELRAEQGKLEQTVDDSADQVASMLSQGPTASNLQNVASSGGFDNLPPPLLLSLPAGVVRSLTFDAAQRYADARLRAAKGLIGPGRFPGSPLFSYTQRPLSAEQLKWLRLARGINVGGTALGFGTTGLTQHLQDLERYPNMDAEERVGRDGGAILSKAVPAFGAGALTVAAIATAPVTVPAVVVGGAAIAAGTGVGYAINKWGGPITEPTIRGGGIAADWTYDEVVVPIGRGGRIVGEAVNDNVLAPVNDNVLAPIGRGAGEVADFAGDRLDDLGL